MCGENIIQNLRRRNIEESKNDFINQIEQNGLISKKHEKVSTIQNYTDHYNILASADTVCTSISAFASTIIQRF